MVLYSSVRMRRADLSNPDFYLLEELAKPRACLISGRIVVWIYQNERQIREVVVCGHAESQTCASVTSILIEAAKQLDEDVQWMLTCGAAYFRMLPHRLHDNPAPSYGLNNPQAILGDMVQALQALARENGLVEVIEQDCEHLAAFRSAFRSRAGTSPGLIVLPNPDSPGAVADFFPIVPGSNPDGKPLIFTLEGWHYDSPAFQLVADYHLRKVQRELLRDALRRRRTYRGWLKEWMEAWLPRLHWLSQSEASEVMLTVPPSAAEAEAPVYLVDILSFLTERVRTFLDRGQTWHQELASNHQHMSFGRGSDAFLDEAIHPTTITEFDFERGVTRTIHATDEDVSYTWRERIKSHDREMIELCLLYIRRMDAIIKPYEELGPRRGGERSRGRERSDKDYRGLRVVEEISQRIVVETMVRGWPSFYLDEKEDRDVFDAWAKAHRVRIWSILARQAKAAGVALDLLLEDNVVYDVRFNDDLGCTLQPLMLIDNAAHAQVHGSRAGASAVVPLWTRQRPNEMSQRVQQLGSTNRERASQLVNQARGYATASHSDPERAASLLRLALACHPPEAGKLILQEWLRRLGRDTTQEFQRARSLMHAAELFAKCSYSEAKEEINSYLMEDPHPVRDAYVIAALLELIRDEPQQAERRATLLRCEKLLARFNDLDPRVRETLQSDPARFSFAFANGELRNQLEKGKLINNEITRLWQRVKATESRMEEELQRRRTIIAQALENSASVRQDYPALALAAEQASEELQATLETQCLFSRWSDDMWRRYADIAKVIEVRGLLDILHTLSSISYRIGKDPKETRCAALNEMHRLSRDPWLPKVLESDLKALAAEFDKGDWDRLQTNLIRAIIREAISTCLQRMQDLLSDEALSGAPMTESITTRIHTTQIVEAKYRSALEMLLTAKVPLGLAISRPWRRLDESMTDFPEDGRLGFDAGQGTIFLNTQSRRVPLLQTDHLSVQESEYVAEIISDPDLPRRINRHAECLAEGFLAAEVEPCPEWRLWRNAMTTISRELLVTLSTFGYAANLMPEHAPPLSDTGEASERRMDQLAARDDPTIDWEWQELGNWQPLMGSDMRRIRDGL